MKEPRGDPSCPRCGAELLGGFRFCPYCGRALDGIDSFEAVLDLSFSKLGTAEAGVSVERLDAMDESLRRLETELDEIACKGQRTAVRRR